MNARRLPDFLAAGADFVLLHQFASRRTKAGHLFAGAIPKEAAAHFVPDLDGTRRLCYNVAVRFTRGGVFTGEQSKKPSKHICIGLLAHVDAGKTTLSEAMLYLAGSVRKLGRVDHKDAFLDTDALERARGITILAKQAEFTWKDTQFTLLDTPGHVDFSAETERALDALDAAVLVISGTDGIQAHTRTLWRLLARHKIPTFLFINKMDLAGSDRAARLAELQSQLSDGCIDCGDGADPAVRAEGLALCDEALMERYLDGQAVGDADVQALVGARKAFPCYFGAALRLEGVEALLDGMARFCTQPAYPAEFGARVFKIARDEQGARLTYLKITGGTLRVKDTLAGPDADKPAWQEKVNQIRIYSGAKYQTVQQAEAGTVCAVTGLTHTRPGEGLGSARDGQLPALEPVLNYCVQPPDGCDAHTLLQALRQLEDEDPMLRVMWNERLGEVHVQLMGEVQLEILAERLRERFDLAATFDSGHIVYKETIAAPVLGVGHFEPLRHYAEVHLLLEPGERGTGIELDTRCSTDVLSVNWQRLILTHLAEKTHVGVLTGAPLTDVKITLLAGRAHLKHTEGGDFRQATYRAVRQGLMQAQNLLLEPYYAFRLEVPVAQAGRAMTDLQRMNGTVQPPDTTGDTAILTGTAPVSSMRGYWSEVTAYTKGQGRLTCTLDGYAPCHNAEEVIAATGYDLTRDLDNPPDSVFCAHGAGYTVKWDEVPQKAHVDPGVRLAPLDADDAPNAKPQPPRSASIQATDKELEEIFVRTYGPIKNRGFEAFRSAKKRPDTPQREYLTRIRPDDYLLVDGYNIIFAWDELTAVAKDDLSAARALLLRILSNFQGVRKCHLIVVFDAYKVRGGVRSVEKDGNIDVVYTKEAETADMYIEKASYDLSRRHRVRVATSDALEQMIILGHGAERLSAKDLKWEVEQANEQIDALIAHFAAQMGKKPE